MTNKLQADYIKDAITPLDFYRHELPEASFRKHEWNDGGLCPFHTDNSKGSFRINCETGAYKCFSCGATGGDIIGFTMALHELAFIDALRQLANDWGLQ